MAPFLQAIEKCIAAIGRQESQAFIPSETTLKFDLNANHFQPKMDGASAGRLLKSPCDDRGQRGSAPH